MTNTCKWYALCENDAAGMVDHPILGKVPTCQRCADKHGATLEPFDDTPETTLRAYDVKFMIAGSAKHHFGRCLTEDGVTGTSDFPKMLGIQRGVPESSITVLEFHPTTL